MGNPNNWTGERLETNISNETMLEHLHRYAIAQELVKGKKVLDIACGEGYGVNLLAKQAGHATGVDNDEETIRKAKKKYKAGNITFKTGSALQIPAENNCFEIAPTENLILTHFKKAIFQFDQNKLIGKLHLLNGNKEYHFFK